jgi:RNA polymerase sigma factor (sigma-70 family)
VEASRVRRPLRLLSRPDRSFEQLYRRHARDVYQYALAVLSNPADAEDVTQTTFLNAYRAFQKGERPQKPHNWLIAIAHNVCRMRWRQAGSRPKEVALDEAPEPVAFDHDRPDLDEVLGALAQLSFNQRAALVMRELEGRSYQEISEVLGVSVSAVEALLFRARRRLQIKRKALGVLTTVPLPGSLTGLFGGGGGAVAVGGAAALALKAAVVVAVGTAVAGAGFKTVHAVTAREAVAKPAIASAAVPAQRQSAAHVRKVAAVHAKPTAAKSKLRRAVQTTAATQASRPTTASGSSAVPAPSSATSSPTPTVAVTTPAPPPVVVKTPPVTVNPPPLPLPVPLPQLPPVPPVTVTVPPLPPPPPLLP